MPGRKRRARGASHLGVRPSLPIAFGAVWIGRPVPAPCPSLVSSRRRSSPRSSPSPRPRPRRRTGACAPSRCPRHPVARLLDAGGWDLSAVVVAPGAFRALGLTWSGIAPIAMEVRTARAGQPFGPWQRARAERAGGPVDRSPRAARRTPASPSGSGARTASRCAPAARPRRVRVVVIDPGSTPRSRPRHAARADAGGVAQPTIVTRAQWGADESLRGDAALRADAPLRRRPPHGRLERLQPGRRARRRARGLPLPHEDAGLVGHRLRVPRRPLRHDLRGPRRRHHAARRRRARVRLQHGLDVGQPDGQLRQGRADARAHGRHRAAAGLAARRGAPRPLGAASARSPAAATATRPASPWSSR